MQSLRISTLGLMLLLAETVWSQSTSEQSGPAVTGSNATAQLRIGMIGLDTSHAPAFTKRFNDPNASSALSKMRVVAAFPGGSQDLASSRDRVEKFTQDLRDLGVEIVESIDALLPKVDAVLLESVDGRKHLEQVLPVFKAGKPVFIDKPLAANLVDAIAIDMLAKKYSARWFSSSSLRFSPSIIRFREDPAAVGKVVGAAAWGPCSLEATHTDLTWYGVHGVETLYTAMGVGCQAVSRNHNADVDFVVGTWAGGRVGTFRGIRAGKTGYGLVVFGESEIDLSGNYAGYEPLIDRIADFFLGGEVPVPNDETLEMFTFMEAADASKLADGQAIQLSDVWNSAYTAAKKKVAELDP